MMLNEHCHRCGEAASVIEDETPLCSDCFLAAALARRRLASPLKASRRVTRPRAMTGDVARVATSASA